VECVFATKDKYVNEGLDEYVQLCKCVVGVKGVPSEAFLVVIRVRLVGLWRLRLWLC
jgi:hypothetical protein